MTAQYIMTPNTAAVQIPVIVHKRRFHCLKAGSESVTSLARAFHSAACSVFLRRDSSDPCSGISYRRDI